LTVSYQELPAIRDSVGRVTTLLNAVEVLPVIAKDVESIYEKLPAIFDKVTTIYDEPLAISRKVAAIQMSFFHICKKICSNLCLIRPFLHPQRWSVKKKVFLWCLMPGTLASLDGTLSFRIWREDLDIIKITIGSLLLP
jgi:hypothetical protein